MKAIQKNDGSYRLMTSPEEIAATDPNAMVEVDEASLTPPVCEEYEMPIQGASTINDGVLRFNYSIVPRPYTPKTKLQLKARLTAQEWQTLRAIIRAAGDDMVENWELATEIRYEDPRTQAMLGALIGTGVMSADRADTIFRYPETTR